MTTLKEVLDEWQLHNDQFPGAREDLERALLVREDQMKDVLYLAGQQFGLFPQIVAEVLAETGLGTPLPPAERAMVRQNFTNLMEAIRLAQEGGGEMPRPPQ